MAFDAHANFGYSTVQAPAPGFLGTSLIVASGQGALFPAAPFNCTVWPSGVMPLASNAEIVRVTAVVGDTLTIARAQEGTGPISIEAGFQIANTTSRKVFTDIEAACVIGAGTQTVTGPFTFADANGVTFGMDNGTITASVGTAAQSTQPVAASASNGSFLFSTLGFSDGNGITFGTNPGGFITASHNGLTSQTVQPVAASASNGSFLFSTLSFTNAFNVTFGTSAGGIIFASVATAAAGNSVNFSAGTQSSNLASIVFADSNGIVFGLSNGTITASNTNALTSQSNQAASASNGSFTFQTLGFTDANGITFGTSAGSLIFASHNGLTSQSNQAASASNGSFTFQTLNFSDANGVTFGTSAGGIITASVAPAAGNYTRSILAFPDNMGNNTTNQNYAGTNRIVIDPFFSPTPLSFNFIQMIVTATQSLATASFSTSTTGQCTYSMRLGFYSRLVTDSGATNFSNSSILTLISSLLWTMQISTSGSSSSKGITFGWQTNSTGGSSTQTFSTNSSAINITGWNGRILFSPPWSMSLPAGEYWLARQWTSSNTNNGSNAFVISFVEMSWNGNSTQASSLGQTAGGGNADGRNMIYPGLGFYTSVNPAGMPNSIDMTVDIQNSNIGQQNWRPYVLKP